MRTYVEETITPEIAKKYLEKDYFRRPLRPDKVRRWAESMKIDAWAFNGHGIGFGILQEDTAIRAQDGTERHAKKGDEVLMDGYHRLTACVEYDQTFSTLVVRGLDPKVLGTIDENTKRTTSDDLAMSGTRDAFRSAALLRKIWLYRNFGGLTRLPKYSVGREELSKMLEADRQLPEDRQLSRQIAETLAATRRWRKSYPGNKGALDFFYWLVRFEFEDNALSTLDRFLDLVTWGAPDAQDKIIRALSASLATGNEYQQERKLNGPEYQVYRMIRVWNGWIQGQTLARLVLPAGGLADPFPAPRRALGR